MISKPSCQPTKLRLVSYLAPNMFWFYQAVGDYLGRALSVEPHVMQSTYSPLEDPSMLQDELDVAFICGLPFVQLNHAMPEQLKISVAPVMQARRYQGCPVYYSDVIVNAESDLMTFDALAGATLCCNDRGSNSGYNLLRQRLIQTRHPCRFFSSVIQSGSHQRSIKLVIDGLADCSAIDSTVLEQELHNSPELATRLRVIESIGPCPIPPVVVARHLGTTFIERLQLALLQPDTELRSAMNRGQIGHFVPVQLEDYNSVSMLYNAAIKAGYEHIG